MNGGKDALLGEAAIEMEFHVAGAFELLEDDLVHAALGVDEGGGDDGEGAAFLDIAGGAEEFFGPCEGLGLDAAGHDAALAGLDGVVAASEAGDAVEKDDDVTAKLDETAGALADELGDLDVTGRDSSKVEENISASVERRRSVTSSGRSSTRRRMTWLWGSRRGCLGDLLEEDGLAVRGGATIRARWPRPSGVIEIDGAGNDGAGDGVLQDDALSVGEGGGKGVEGLGMVQVWGGMPSMEWISSRARNFSRSRAQRRRPMIRWPVWRPKRRTRPEGT